MKTRELKIEQQYLDDLLSGKKTFELRVNDRNYQKGDQLLFKNHANCDPFPKDESFEILSVFSGKPTFGLNHGWVILSLKQIK